MARPAGAEAGDAGRVRAERRRAERGEEGRVDELAVAVESAEPRAAGVRRGRGAVLHRTTPREE